MPPEVLRKAKQLGFSDKQIALAVQRWVGKVDKDLKTCKKNFNVVLIVNSRTL